MVTIDAELVGAMLGASAGCTCADGLAALLEALERGHHHAWSAAIWEPEGDSEVFMCRGAALGHAEQERTRQALREALGDATLAQGVRCIANPLGDGDSTLMPLRVAGAVRGGLLLGPGAQPAVSDDAWECASLAAGAAVECAGLRGQLSQQKRLTQTLYRVSQASISSQNLDSLLNLIVRLAVETIDRAENCVLHLLDEQSGLLQPQALSFVEGKPINREGRMRMRLGQGAAGRALESARVINIGDVNADPRFLRSEHDRVFGSMIVAPIVLGEKRLGTLSVDSPDRHAFTDEHERVLLTLASHAASAIENSRLLRDLQASLAEQQRMQGQLVQVEKLSALGRMIAGVSHELNNPLTAVMGYAQLLLMSESLGGEERQDIERIYTQADRAARIVRSLQMFARAETGARQLVDINEIVESVLELQAAQLRLEHIDLVKRLDSRPLAVFGDYYQLQQVFFHLISNARDAMTAHRGGGCLTVSTARLGNAIEVRVQDDGAGIPADVRPRVFDPFFTTKGVGQSTGLGLSVVYGIVTGHSGRVFADTAEGQGSVFVVQLPAAE